MLATLHSQGHINTDRDTYFTIHIYHDLKAHQKTFHLDIKISLFGFGTIVALSLLELLPVGVSKIIVG